MATPFGKEGGCEGRIPGVSYSVTTSKFLRPMEASFLSTRGLRHVTLGLSVSPRNSSCGPDLLCHDTAPKQNATQWL